MIINYRETKVFYKLYDRKSELTDVYLHGWGCDSKSLLFCKDYLKKHNALFVDFPPFGESDKKLKDWSVFTYANMVISLMQHLKIKRFNIVGHSFGGRIAILISVLCKAQTNKIVLVDSAGLKPKRSLNYYFKVWTFKLKRRLGMDVSKYGSCDYLALDEDMRKIFKSIVNTHLDDFLPFIKADTLVVFGQNDKVTPIYMAKKFKKKIKNSKLLILPDAGHFCFVDKKLEFVLNLKNFLENDEQKQL